MSIKPIEELISKNIGSRIIVIPQDSLFLVPFAALRDENGQYIITRHPIVISPSIKLLEMTYKQAQRSSSQEGWKSLVVGNPKMPKVALSTGREPIQLSELPGAQQEAESVAKILNNSVLSGEQATKAVVVNALSSARIAHFATHALLDDFRGLNSAIALASSSYDNGLLTAEEIFSFQLSAEMVVLSACNTGCGRICGDGIIGLSRAFISAGVPSVVVSLWPTFDSSGVILMSEFYRNYEIAKLDKAEALQQAMLAMIADPQYSHPSHWAAFILVGEA